MIPRSIARDYSLLDGGKKTDTAMTQELEQLLKNLKLRRILDIYDEQTEGGRERGRFVLRVRGVPGVRAVAPAAGMRSGMAHPARQPARVLVAGTFPPHVAAGRQLQQVRAFAELEFVPKTENIVVNRQILSL